MGRGNFVSMQIVREKRKNGLSQTRAFGESRSSCHFVGNLSRHGAKAKRPETRIITRPGFIGIRLKSPGIITDLLRVMKLDGTAVGCRFQKTQRGMEIA